MKIILHSLALFCCFNFSYAQPGVPDPTFGNNGIVGSDLGSPLNKSAIGNKVLLVSDGSMYFVTQSAELAIIAKKLQNGSADITYGMNGYSLSIPIHSGHAILQADGKIVIAGNTYTSNQSSYNHTDFAIARINIDGSPDSTFDGDGLLTEDLGAEENASSVAIQSDGKIVIAVNILDGESGTQAFALKRYKTDGSPDGESNSTGGNNQSVSTLVIQSDGKILVGGDLLHRYKSDLTPDSSFNGIGSRPIPFSAAGIAIQGDGKIIIAGGNLDENNWPVNFTLARFNPNGGPDNMFGENGIQTTSFGGSNEWLTSIAIQNNGRIILGGYTEDGNQANFAISRYDAKGKPDSSFSADGKQTTDLGSANDYINSIAIHSDGKILVLGYTNDGVKNSVAAVRYNTNGTRDNTFDGDGQLIEQASQGSAFYTCTAIQKDGKVLAAGYSWNGSNYDFAIVRYNKNGSFDPTFSDDGKQMNDLGATDDKINAIAIQNDGKILVAGSAGDNFGISRYNTNGSLDISFGTDGMQITDFGDLDFVSSLAIQADGKILAGGSIVARYDSGGSRDMSFHGDGKLAIDCNDMAMQSDGKIVIASGSGDVLTVSRYYMNGLPDSTFGDNGVKAIFLFIDYTYLIGKSIKIQTDGKIIIGGYYEYNYRNITTAFVLMRLNPDGSMDETFNGGQPILNSINAYSHATSVVIQTNSQVIIAGYSYNGSSDDFTMARYNTGGDLDYTFNDGGIVITKASPGNDRIAGIAMAENKLYAVGFGQFHGNIGVVARYLLGPEGGPWDSPFITGAGGNWNDPGTWIGGVVPYSTSRVIVQHNVTITTGTTCYSLIVEPPAGNLVITTGVNLTITH